MRIDIDNLNPGVWFDWKDDARVCLRTCPMGELKRIENETTKRQWKWRRNQRYEEIERDEAKEQELIWDYCIVDWENLVVNDDEPFPCTSQNKARLMRESVSFASFIAECLETLNDQITRHEDDLEKNS